MIVEHLLGVHFDQALGDDSTHRLNITLVNQVEDPSRNASIGLLLPHPHQQLVLTAELDQRVGDDWGTAERKLTGLVNDVNQVL